MKQYSFNTRVLHTPYFKDDNHGTLRMPVYDAAAFEYPDAESLEAAFSGTKPGHVYSRSTNPTVEYLEHTVNTVTDALGTIAFSSGMAAISNVLLLLLKAGDNVVTTNHIFGNTFSLFYKTLKPFGIEFKFTDLTDISRVEKQMDNNTRVIFLETITNPMLEVVDIKAISELAKKQDVVLIVDTTLTPLCFFNAKELGIDIEILSSTKYISGGGTSIGGLVIDHGIYDWTRYSKLDEEVKKFGHFAFIGKLRKEIHRNLGACLSPHNAYLQSLGLETLSMRAEKSCANALTIAKWLSNHPKVKQVNYPGLENSEFHEIAKKQFKNKFGALITFDLESKSHCFKFLNKLQLVRRATNLNDNKSLALHPASTIFVEYAIEDRAKLGVREGMIRLAVGIEDVEDLIFDLERALKQL